MSRAPLLLRTGTILALTGTGKPTVLRFEVASPSFEFFAQTKRPTDVLFDRIQDINPHYPAIKKRLAVVRTAT
jgi:hypothetical protein